MNRRIVTTIVGVLAVFFIWNFFSKKQEVSSDDVEYVQMAKAKASGQSQAQKQQVTGSAQELYDQAMKHKKNRNLVQARDLLQTVFNEHPDFEQIDLVQKDLENLNMEIIYSNVPTSETIMHEVKSGDTLGKLAQTYGTTIELIKLNNHLKSDVIRVGQKLRIWNAKFNIFVDKSQNILILKTDKGVVKVYDVSTGKNNSTPVGEFKVTTKLVDPVWFNRGVVVPPESPANVLGSRWLGFDIPGYGIHGTIEPNSIGTQATAGCVRMVNNEVEELYSLIPIGTKVNVVD